MHWLYSKKILGFLTAFMFVLTGTYNAVVINSESHITSDGIRFVKRLDEAYGVVTPARMVAASTQWKKLEPHEMKSSETKVIQMVNTTDAAPAIQSEAQSVAVAAVQEELDLGLMEVINPRKWQQGLTPSQFSGNLTTNNGTIENMSVSLPNGEGISVSFSEMSGNVFEYDLDGEVYSGMMYQVDQGSYMVTLSNGPLEGTRLRFGQGAAAELQQSSQPEQRPEVQSEIQQEVSQDQPVEPGNFGSEQQEIPQQEIQAYEPYQQPEVMMAQQEQAVQQEVQEPQQNF